MTDKQPEALRWADVLVLNVGTQLIHRKQAAAELRRLHEVNDALVQALQIVVRGVPDTWEGVKQAKAALTKAEGK